MLTFFQFITERQHDSVGEYRDWGVIHPKTGHIFSGLEHPTATRHCDLTDALVKAKKLPPRPYMGDHAEYAHVHFKDGDGHLMLRNVTPANRAAVHKAFHNLPHHPSKRVEMDHQDKGKRKHTAGTALKVYNVNKAALEDEKKRMPWLHEDVLLEYEFGFLRHGKPALKKHGIINNGDHTTIAQKMGYKANHTGSAVDQALQAGHVRYWHNRKGDYHPFNHTHAEHGSIGYEFHDTPKQRELVKRHLAKSGGATEIYMDMHHPDHYSHNTPHKFTNTEAAIKHLES